MLHNIQVTHLHVLVDHILGTDNSTPLIMLSPISRFTISVSWLCEQPPINLDTISAWLIHEILSHYQTLTAAQYIYGTYQVGIRAIQLIVHFMQLQFSEPWHSPYATFAATCLARYHTRLHQGVSCIGYRVKIAVGWIYYDFLWGSKFARSNLIWQHIHLASDNYDHTQCL